MIACRPYLLCLVTLATGLTLAAATAPRAALAQDQPSTAWDAELPPAGDRTAEYKTDTVDTWIRLTPYLGVQFYTGFDFSGQAKGDSGPAVMPGIMLEFEAADVVLVSIDFSVGFSQYDEAFGTDIDKADVEMYGFGVYIALNNPELTTDGGGFRVMPGLGVGAKYLPQPRGFRPEFDETGGARIRIHSHTADPEVEEVFDQTLLAHGTIFVRFEFRVSSNIQFGFIFREHFVFYSSEAIDDEQFDEEGGSAGLALIHEPLFYLSITF